MTSKILKTILLATAVYAVGSGGPVTPRAIAAEKAPMMEMVSEEAPPSFATPEEAVAAFKAAVTAKDKDKLANLLGLDPTKAKASDDADETVDLIAEGVSKSLIVRDIDGAKILVIGEKLWPMPFPLSKEENGKWSFDTFEGLQEIVARRVGENELQTIATMLEYVDAQNTYEAEDHDGDAVREYAQKLISSDGNQDGLYWETEQGDIDDVSPGGDALADAEFQKAKAGDGYFGYRYRILTGQGANIAGGQFNYIINGNMIAGFGLVAWPVKYGETGIHTFVVNKEGIVYQADLGADTEKLASNMKTFNPGDAWEIAKEE
ncbi:DUF2950 family protein [Rhizobium sp. TH2]|uniref:DUF2950 domain-containing protein n=1 Tax=Rhizobium sp. TH2 TaxID=2775403 RepID=UPI00215725B2|nr:DUF2950 domain-containing protein [Rhizobium sp. TH2]UVC06668.1 DUF2950 family protein [Rhizobium sp. TH2]